MKIVCYSRHGGSDVGFGLLEDDGIVDITSLIPERGTAQRALQALIDGFEGLRSEIEHRRTQGNRIPLGSVRLLAPVPRPGKVLGCIGNYWEHAQREANPLNMFLKNPDAVIGPGDTVVLPEMTDPWIFMHEAELALVIKGPAKSVARDDWSSAVFGYTCLIDVSARGEGRMTWRSGSWMGKSFDTFCPIGPCIVTADAIEDPNDLHVQLWNSKELRHNYNTDDMEHRVPELIEFASRIMTLYSGDLIACGTNHEGLGPIQHGEQLEIEIQGIGRMSVGVEDPLRRSWERGIYMGADSTNHAAVRRHRPREAARLSPVPDDPS